MAAPITHIVLTEKVYNLYFSHLDRKKFFVGTSFPDIRYLGVIDREKTHLSLSSMQEIAQKDSFTAGMCFHAYLDIVREKFIVSRDLYSLVPESPFITQAVKFLEDMVFYDRVRGWEVIRSYFDDVLTEEIAFGVSMQNVHRWHKVLQRAFSNTPTPEDVTEFVNGIGKPLEMAQEINRVVSVIRDNQKVLAIIEELYENFENMIGEK